MERKEYHGYTNYETWATALWIDNEQGSSEQAVAAARECLEESVDGGLRSEFTPESVTDADLARYELANRLKDWIEEAMPDVGASLAADLLGAALAEVDWDDLARHYLGAAEEVLA